MNNRDLYFISILEEALAHDDLQHALPRAFRRIEQLGSTPEFAEGYEQFKRFMQEIRTSHERAAELLDNEWLALLTEEFLPSDIEYGGGPVANTRGTPIPVLHLRFTREHEVLKEMAFDEGCHVHRVSGLTPGRYALCLRSGRVLWESHLGPQELLWRVAYPGEPFAAAADTGDQRYRLPTREFRVGNDELRLRFYASLESGEAEISDLRWSGDR